MGTATIQTEEKCKHPRGGYFISRDMETGAWREICFDCDEIIKK